MRYWYCELPPQLVCNTSPPYPSPTAPSPLLLPFFAAQLQSQRSHSRSRSHHRCRRRGRRRSRSLRFIIALLARQSGVSWPPCSLSLSLSLHVSMYNQTYIHTYIHTYSFTYVCVCCSHSLCDVDYSLCMHACVCPPPILPPPATTYHSISDLLLSPFRLHSD